MLDAFKDLGFHYASKAGITISKNDVEAPPEKEAILGAHRNRRAGVQSQYEMGLITNEERREKVIDKWNRGLGPGGRRRWRRTSTGSTRST